MIHGGKIIVSKKSGNSWVVAVAAAKSCEIGATAEMVPISAPSISNGSWQHVIAGLKSWRVTVNALVTTVEQILGVGTEVQLKIYNADTTSDSVTGYAYIQELRQTGTWGNLAQYAVVFVGNGPLSAT